MRSKTTAAAELPELVPLVISHALASGLGPVADRLRDRFELVGQLLGRAAAPDQTHHLSAELGRVRRT
jgi:hypothetical protein